MRKMFWGALLASAVTMPNAAHAAAVQITNAGFEDGIALADGGFAAGHIFPVPGWGASGGSGTGRWNPDGQFFSDEALHGAVGFASGNGLTPFATSTMIAQTVQGEVLRANTRYTLTVDVGNYFGTSASWDYRIGLISELNAGGFVLAEGGGSAVQQGTFKTVDFVFETGATGAGIGKAFAIGLSGFGQGAAFDNVKLGVASLAAVPEPQTWATMIAGFALAGAAARRRRPQAAMA